MILRFVSKEGQFRLNVEPTTTFPEVLPQIAEKLPKSVDIQSISVSNRPQGGDARKLADLKGVSFKQVGLSYVACPSLTSELISPQTRCAALSHLRRAVYHIKWPFCSSNWCFSTKWQARRPL